VQLTVEQCLVAIESHTRALAAAAETDLDARIEHCPDWSMSDLVWHLIGVHRFWNKVATDLPADEPDEVSDQDRPADDLLIAELLRGMEAMVATLRAADQDAACWTWGLEQNVRFITRHQVQEAAVHHWDAVNAGRDAEPWSIDPVVAMDAVDEMLTHSLPNERWPADDVDGLGGTLWFCACLDPVPEADSWHVFDGDLPGTLGHRTYHLGERAPQIEGPSLGAHVSAGDLLLWFYERIGEPGDSWEGEPRLLERLTAIAG